MSLGLMIRTGMKPRGRRSFRLIGWSSPSGITAAKPMLLRNLISSSNFMFPMLAEMRGCCNGIVF
jgi:hypothetical protein